MHSQSQDGLVVKMTRTVRTEPLGIALVRTDAEGVSRQAAAMFVSSLTMVTAGGSWTWRRDREQWPFGSCRFPFYPVWLFENQYSCSFLGGDMEEGLGGGILFTTAAIFIELILFAVFRFTGSLEKAA